MGRAFIACIGLLLLVSGSVSFACPGGCNLGCQDSDEWSNGSNYFKFSSSIGLNNVCDPSPKILSCPIQDPVNYDVWSWGSERCVSTLSVGVFTSGSTKLFSTSGYYPLNCWCGNGGY